MGKVMGVIVLLIGIFILVGSIVLYVAATSTVNDYETTAGQITRALDEDAEMEYEAALGLQVCSGIGMVMGAIFSLVGGYLIFRTEPKSQQSQVVIQQPQYPQQPYPQPYPQQYQQPYQQPNPPPPPPTKPLFCHNCGNQINPGTKFCVACGSKQS